MTADRRRRTFAAPTGLPDAGALASRPRVAVVGGGIAGLAAATGLAERGVAVEVIESDPSAGGWGPGPNGMGAPSSR
jgi:isorenieratene synthase